MARYDFPDAAWALILPLLPPERSQRPGHPYIEHRKVINGMFWVLCFGFYVLGLPGVIYPNAMGHGKPSTTVSTGGQKRHH